MCDKNNVSFLMNKEDGILKYNVDEVPYGDIRRINAWATTEGFISLQINTIRRSTDTSIVFEHAKLVMHSIGFYNNKYNVPALTKIVKRECTKASLPNGGYIELIEDIPGAADPLISNLVK